MKGSRKSKQEETVMVDLTRRLIEHQTHHRQFFEKCPEFMYAYNIAVQLGKPVLVLGDYEIGRGEFAVAAADLTQPVDSTMFAPSSAVARNVGAVSLDSYFRLPYSAVVPTPELIDNIRLSQDERYFLYSMAGLPLTEMSLLSSGRMDLLDKVCQQLHGNEVPFGGKKLLMMADPFQLPPVLDKEAQGLIFKTYPSEHFFDAQSFRQLDPLCIEIKSNFSGVENDYLQMLRDIRVAKNLGKNAKLINNRCFGKVNCEKSTLTQKKIILTLTNHETDSINNVGLLRTNGYAENYPAIVSGEYNWGGEGVEQVLRLKENCRVRFTTSDLTAGFKCGELGRVISMNDDYIKVEKDDGIQVSVERYVWRRYQFTSHRVKKGIWERREKVIGSMKQFPLKLSWAMTLYASQGLTFERVHLKNYTWYRPGQLYAGLTRCRSFERLTMDHKISHQKLKVNQRVSAFYQQAFNPSRLQEEVKNVVELLDSWKRDAGEQGAVA